MHAKQSSVKLLGMTKGMKLMTHVKKLWGYLVDFFLYLLLSFFLRYVTFVYFLLEIVGTVDDRLCVTRKVERCTNISLNFLDGQAPCT